MELLQYNLLGNTVKSWLIAGILALVILLVIKIVRAVLCRQFQKLANSNDAIAWDVMYAVIRKGGGLFFIIISVFFASLYLSFSDRLRDIINQIAMITLILQSGIWISAGFRAAIDAYREEQKEKDPASITKLNVLTFSGRFIIWVTVLLLALDNLGVNITALIAGLGIGGVAVALALQTVLGDLFASLSIVLDKPFVVGDFLIVGDLLGAVEYVGLKTTRLRSLSGEQLIFSNSDLLNSRIRNFGRMYERRVAFDIGVTYQTSRDNLKKIPQIIKQAILSQEKTRFDRSHFKEYADFSLKFESVYFIKGPDYNEYMDIHQAINLYIHEQFEQCGIEFAYPTQTVFLQKNS